MANGEASVLFCLYMPKDNAVLADKNATLSFCTKGRKNFSGESIGDVYLLVTFKNKTKRTLYIDMANTFFIRGKESFPFYVPSMTSHTQGETTGVGIALGPIGIGGSSSESTTVTTMTLRIIAVPPMAEKTLEHSTSLFPIDADIYNDELRYTGLHRVLTLYLPKEELVKTGECRNWDKNCSIGALGVVLTYATDESITNPQALNADFSIQHVVDAKTGHYAEIKYFDTNSVSANYKETLHFYAKQKKK